MKIKSHLKPPLSTVMLLLAIFVLLMNSCAGLDALIHREKNQEPMQPTRIKVFYSGNGNTGGAAPVDDNLYEPGEKVPVLKNTGDLTLAGYTFTGWNTHQDGSGTGYSASTTDTNTSLTAADKDMILYAVWSRDVFLKAGDNYTGSIEGQAVHIETGGIWEITGNSTILYLDLKDISIDQNRIITQSIMSNGYNIYFDEYQDQDSTFINSYGLRLPGGGMIMPKIPADVEASVNAAYYVDAAKKEISDEEIIIGGAYSDRSAVYVKNGGTATLRHCSIRSSSFNSASHGTWEYSNARWGVNSALYSSFAGTLAADDLVVTTAGGGAAGACASYQGYIRLSNSSILCEETNGNSPGVLAIYGGRIDIENTSIETCLTNGPVLVTGPGGGAVTVKGITGIAHAQGSAGIYTDTFGRIYMEASGLRSENDSAVVICPNGETIVKDSTLVSNTTAVRTGPSGQGCRVPGAGTFINTRIISGSDAFQFNGISADIIVRDGTTVEFPKGCRLIKADSSNGAEQDAGGKSDPVDGTFTAENVILDGNIELAEDGTRLMVSLKDGTLYKGAVYGAAISIDATSQWTVTETSIIAGIDRESASRIYCPAGLRVYYDGDINYLGTIPLTGGGELVAVQDS